MKPPPFEYFAPATLADAVRLLSTLANPRLLAGGQSLMPMLNMRYLFPDQIIDLNAVAELDFIRESGGDVIIGAMTRQRMLQRSPVVALRLPLFARALRYVGHVQTRNRGTIGGSLCHLDPSAELPALAMAYDAVVEATGPGGTRSISFTAFPAGYMTPDLRAGEILTSLRFTPWATGAGYGFREFSRRHGDFAIAGAIAMLELDEAGAIARASLTLFGVAPAPVRAQAAEAMLAGLRPSKDLLVAAAQSCIELATLEDPYAGARYRGQVAATMAEHALLEAAAEACNVKVFA